VVDIDHKAHIKRSELQRYKIEDANIEQNKRENTIQASAHMSFNSAPAPLLSTILGLCLFT
jgi:hypothetical protein